MESYKHPHESTLQKKVAGGSTGPEQRRWHPAFYRSFVITFNGNTTVLMGHLWKQSLLKLSVRCKAQIPEKPVAAFNLWLCQHIPCDTAWQPDSPGDHFTLSLSSKALTGHKLGTEPFLNHHIRLPVPGALIEQHVSLV